MTRILRRLVKWFYLLVAMLLILFAVVVQSGRSFSYLVSDYQQNIVTYLSTRLNAEVKVKHLQMDWQGLKPGVEIRGMELRSKTGHSIVSFDRAMMRLDILRSLQNFRLVWNDLRVEKVNLRFQQQANGFWKIPGLDALQTAEINPEQARTNLNPLIDMLLLSRHLSLSESNLQFEFNDQKILSLRAPDLVLENKGSFHRLSLEVDIEDQSRSLFLMVEAKGDPRNTRKLQAKAYLELNEFPTSEPLQAATTFLLGGQESHLTSEGNISAKIWMDSRKNGDGFNLTGTLNLQRLLVEIQKRHLALDQFAVEMVGHWLPSGKWQLGLQNIHAELAKEKIDNMNLVATSSGFNQSLQLRLDHLDLQDLHQLLTNAGILGEDGLARALSGLQPQGHLHQVQLTLPYRDAKNWQLAALLRQVSVSPWQGVPGLTSVDGYLQTDAKGGFISLDSQQGFSMFFPTLYKEAMQYDRVSGQVAWHLQKNNNRIYVNSGALNFYQGDEHTTGYMWLAMPWVKGTADVELALQIGSRQLNASQYKKYTPQTLSPNLLEWLSQSIGDNNPGTVRNIGFIYRASLNIKEAYARTYQLAMDLDNTQLAYHHQWPELKQLSASLRLNDAHIYGDVKAAQIFDTSVDNARIEMHPKKSAPGSLLSIKASMKGSASDGLRVLREGALRQYLGESMDSWFMSGNLQTRLDLIVPIASKNPAADAYQDVDVDMDVPVFEIKNLNLQMKNLRGKISYNNSSGLSSKNLQAVLFDEPVNASLMTVMENDARRTRIKVDGAIDTDSLTNWTKRPETRFLKGRMPYDLIVDLKHNNQSTDDNKITGVLQSSHDFIDDAFAEIKLTSDLKGVEVDLPKPYGKKASSKRSLSFNLWLQPDYSQIQAVYDGKIDSLFRVLRAGNGRLLNANIALSSEAKFASDDGIHASEFLVSGHLASFDLQAWKNAQQKYSQYQLELNPAQEIIETDQPHEIAGLPFKADINLGEYEVGSIKFQDINVGATRHSSGWNLQIDNPKVRGEVEIPFNSTSPLGLNFRYLYLETAKSSSSEQDINSTNSEPVDPRHLPLAKVEIEQLFFDGEAWGNIGFEIKPNVQGVLIDNITGQIRGMSFRHKTANRGAQLFWQINEQGHTSRFAGRLTASNMAEVLHQWKKPEMVESESAELKVDINWLSTPQNFSLVDIAGQVELQLNEGRFHREATAGDGLLRLMSILNFDSLARRLRLDFSDLYKTGLAYEQISGKVSFDHGTMSFIEPLVVRSPSSDLQMAGSLNLRDETIDTRIVANLPVAGNLTFYAALATGLPAAAGVYLVSKIFKKQVNQFASVSYTMTGPWEKPKVKFDRLFESEDSLREKTRDAEKSIKESQPDLSVILESNPYLQPTMESRYER